MGRVGREERGGQRRGRRLALRAGHPDRRAPGTAAGTGPPRTRAPGPSRSPPARASTSAASAARRRGSVVGKSGVDRRRRRDERRRRPRSPPGRRPARAASVTGRPPSAAIASPSSLGRPAVVDRHARAGIGEEARQRDAAAGQPEDGDRPVAERPGADAVERQRVEIDRRRVVVMRRHRSRSSEARKSVTPSSAGEDPDDPEADRDLLLVPAAQLEVVVERAHPEEPLAAGQLEVADLEDHRRGLDDEDDPDQRQHQDLAGDQRGDGQRRAERQRARIADEDLRRVDVEPQEARAARR